MAKYIIDEATLKGLADALRKVIGETRSYTPAEMIEAVTNIMDSATYILVDENGNEVPAVYVDSEVVLTATPNDIRIGTTAVTDDGVTEGEKEIPSYVTTEGYKVITNGSAFYVHINNYDYTKLQAILCPFNTSIADSVAAEKVVIDDKVYPVQSTGVEATVTIDDENGDIDFGITNTSGESYLIRYFTYKEIY